VFVAIVLVHILREIRDFPSARAADLAIGHFGDGIAKRLFRLVGHDRFETIRYLISLRD
jgi:hypothetical protein